MDRIIKVIGEKEEKARKLLLPIENEVRKRARISYGIQMPLYNGIFFVHMKNERKLGSFLLQERIIILSEELLDSPLSTLKNVFIHECAHALDYALNGVTSGHSPYFKELCSFLGIEEGFEKAKIEASLLNKEKKKEKLEKLLAMTSSSFENEAMIALNKARKLIEEDGILAKENESDKIYMVDVYAKKRISAYIAYISLIISDNIGVFFVKEHTNSEIVLRAYGSVDQCESTLYLFDYLLSSLEKEIKKQKKEGKTITKDSFMIGAYRALKEKSKVETTALVKSIKNETEKRARRIAFNDTHLRKSQSKVHLDKSSYDSGSSFGKTLNLNKQKRKLLN